MYCITYCLVAVCGPEVSCLVCVFVCLVSLKRRSAIRQWPEDLDEIMRPIDNQLCADCGASEVANASLALGVTLCNECSGIHRVLGLGGASIKSLRMRWKPEQIQVQPSEPPWHGIGRYQDDGIAHPRPTIVVERHCCP
jgi:hypothetical protein